MQRNFRVSNNLTELLVTGKRSADTIRYHKKGLESLALLQIHVK